MESFGSTSDRIEIESQCFIRLLDYARNAAVSMYSSLSITALLLQAYRWTINIFYFRKDYSRGE